MKPLKIGIAGAGIGGLAAGALLAKDGHQITIYDQFEAPQPVGSGLVIQPVGQHALYAAGAGSALNNGAHITQMLGHEVTQGRPVLDVSYGASSAAHFGLAIHRSSLFNALLQAAQSAGATLQSAHSIASYKPGDRPALIFADGSQSPQFDLLVDASGASSKLSPLRSKPLPFGAVWGTVPWPSGCKLPQNELRQKYKDAAKMAGILPIGALPDQPGAHAAIFWSLPVEQMAQWKTRGLQAWIDDAVDLWPAFKPFAAQITDLEQLTPARYAHGTLRKPYLPGLAIIGDAAHRASPQLGQGANMALLDAFALRQALRQTEAEEALPLYASTRRWHVKTYQMTSAVFTPMYQSSGRLLPALRDHVLYPLSRIPPVPKLLSHLVCGTMLPPVREFSRHLVGAKTNPPTRAE